MLKYWNNFCAFPVEDPKDLQYFKKEHIHLKEHKFRHNFVDAINPLCSCGNFVELTFINKIKDTDKRMFDKNDSLKTQTLLFGDEKLSITDNKSILEATIQLLISSGRFDSPLY